MDKEARRKVEPVTRAEVKAMASKLESFAADLPPKERALLNLFLSRSNAKAALETTEFEPSSKITESLIAAFSDLVKVGLNAGAWVEAGDPWVQSGGGWVEGGDPWVQGGGGWVEGGDPWVQSGGRPGDDYIRVATQASELGRFLNPSVEAPQVAGGARRAARKSIK